MILALFFLFHISSNTCSKNDACSIQGGFFSDKEVDFIKSQDASGFLNIYKNKYQDKIYVYYFFSYDCPHCKKANNFLEELSKEHEDIIIKKYEIKKNYKNLDFFYKISASYNTNPMGVPTIFIGDKYFVGFYDDVTCIEIINEINKIKGIDCIDDTKQINVPLFGLISIDKISLPSFTFYIGLLDGLNPCAMWVLMFLLGLLVYARDRRKVLFIGFTFIIASGFVYFLFMLAWFNLFSIIGYSRIITSILAVLAILMGLLNIKELFFFKKGISLMIPEKYKPTLYKKAREVLNQKNKFLAIIGTIILAFFVNLIELGCTIGLPAIYTRILYLREINDFNKILYIAFYNLAYIVPLLLIVLIFTVTMGHFKFNEKHAKILKLISGVLMLSLGLILLFSPRLLTLS